MLPVEMFCGRCGGFLRMVMTDGEPARSGEHSSPFDCIDELRELISKISVGPSDKPAGLSGEPCVAPDPGNPR
jgi:hypothetical protein